MFTGDIKLKNEARAARLQYSRCKNGMTTTDIYKNR